MAQPLDVQPQLLQQLQQLQQQLQQQQQQILQLQQQLPQSLPQPPQPSTMQETKKGNRVQPQEKTVRKLTVLSKIERMATFNLSQSLERLKASLAFLRFASLHHLLALEAAAVVFSLVSANSTLSAISIAEEGRQSLVKSFTPTAEGAAKLRHAAKIYSHLNTGTVPQQLPEVNTFGIFSFTLGLPGSKPSTYAALLQAVLCVARAVQYLQSLDPIIVHCDIRWPNVVRSLEDPALWLLIDFDEARLVRRRGTEYETEQMSNTPHNGMQQLSNEHAPELLPCSTTAVTPATDIWGIGSLLRAAREWSVCGSQVAALLKKPVVSSTTEVEPKKRATIGEVIETLESPPEA
eukprot:TRINITY_DN19149_c0_g1_i1.p1 TRINITY_DN19149_c0_g1~~TRINITY_DN19149_c0_g1_i1.p1  ORF type:complete len:369 (+),score=88.01 TRINITY_DN19149_c0_g1_i1:61-1107(+)